MLKGFAARWGTAVEAEDRMDDGSPIRLRVQVDPQEVSRRPQDVGHPPTPKMGFGGALPGWDAGPPLVPALPAGQRRLRLLGLGAGGVRELQCPPRHHPLCPHLLPALHGGPGHPPQPGGCRTPRLQKAWAAGPTGLWDPPGYGTPWAAGPPGLRQSQALKPPGLWDPRAAGPPWAAGPPRLQDPPGLQKPWAAGPPGCETPWAAKA